MTGMLRRFFLAVLCASVTVLSVSLPSAPADTIGVTNLDDYSPLVLNNCSSAIDISGDVEVFPIVEPIAASTVSFAFPHDGTLNTVRNKVRQLGTCVDQSSSPVDTPSISGYRYYVLRPQNNGFKLIAKTDAFDLLTGGNTPAPPRTNTLSGLNIPVKKGDILGYGGTVGLKLITNSFYPPFQGSGYLGGGTPEQLVPGANLQITTTPDGSVPFAQPITDPNFYTATPLINADYQPDPDPPTTVSIADVAKSGCLVSSSSRGKSAKRSRKRCRKGVTVTYALSSAATVNETLTRVIAARSVRNGGKCKRSLKNGHKCTISRTVASATLSGNAGSNSDTIKNTFGGKKLRTGNYVLTLAAADSSANASGQATVTLKVR